jgi:hypothetical protein
MQLLIEQQYQTLIPLPSFREQWHLPDDFEVALFEPKEWTELGSMEGAGRDLSAVRQRVGQAVPTSLPPARLREAIEALTRYFEQELQAANTQVGLREVEVDFAVAGFGDVLQAVAYRLIQLAQLYRHDPAQVEAKFDFTELYQSWLDGSVRLSTKIHTYRQGETEFKVQILNNVYGRIGLEVETGGERYYILDMALACPAASYMRSLCGEVAQKICQAVVEALQSNSR